MNAIILSDSSDDEIIWVPNSPTAVSKIKNVSKAAKRRIECDDSVPSKELKRVKPKLISSVVSKPFPNEDSIGDDFFNSFMDGFGEDEQQRHMPNVNHNEDFLINDRNDYYNYDSNIYIGNEYRKAPKPQGKNDFNDFIDDMQGHNIKMWNKERFQQTSWTTKKPITESLDKTINDCRYSPVDSSTNMTNIDLDFIGTENIEHNHVDASDVTNKRVAWDNRVKSNYKRKSNQTMVTHDDIAGKEEIRLDNQDERVSDALDVTGGGKQENRHTHNNIVGVREKDLDNQVEHHNKATNGNVVDTGVKRDNPDELYHRRNRSQHDDISSVGDDKRENQLERLHKALNKLKKEIAKLETSEVDLSNEDNSTFISIERYKKRACELFQKICELNGESKSSKNRLKQKIRFNETKYPQFNKSVEKHLSKSDNFPLLSEVLKLLKDCNRKYNLRLGQTEINSTAENAFVRICKMLQKRRKFQLYKNINYYSDGSGDPASNDPALLAKLTENSKHYSRVNEIINEYAQMEDAATSSKPGFIDTAENDKEDTENEVETDEDEELEVRERLIDVTTGIITISDEE